MAEQNLKAAEPTISTVEDEERLESLRQWAEGKKYVQQGEEGTLPNIYGGMGIKGMTYGSGIRQASDREPARNGSAGGATTADPPEDEQGLVDGNWKQQRRPSKIKEWIQKRRRSSVQNNTP